MKEFRLQSETWIPRPRSEIFPFFAEARNLQQLTPPWLKFEVLTPAPIDMRPGTLIDYRITVHGLPIRWRTEIAEWDPRTGSWTSNSAARTPCGITPTPSRSVMERRSVATSCAIAPAAGR